MGKIGTHDCACPLGFSYKTFDSYIGKLRALCHAIGHDGEWDKRLGLGNPAADRVVKDYLRLVTTEKLRARITPKQASPFFEDKLAELAAHIDKCLQSAQYYSCSTLYFGEGQGIFQGGLVQ